MGGAFKACLLLRWFFCVLWLPFGANSGAPHFHSKRNITWEGVSSSTTIIIPLKSKQSNPPLSCLALPTRHQSSVWNVGNYFVFLVFFLFIVFCFRFVRFDSILTDSGMFLHICSNYLDTFGGQCSLIHIRHWVFGRCFSNCASAELDGLLRKCVNNKKTQKLCSFSWGPRASNSE